MWSKMRIPLVLLSVAFNAAFGTAWLRQALTAAPEAPPSTPPTSREIGTGRVWCPLHRSLGTSGQQWQQIEPRLVAFQDATGALEDQIERQRAELIDLAAAPVVDREALRARQQEILTGQQKMQDLVVAYLLEEKQSLTPEQQKALFDLIRQRSGCRGGPPGAGGSPSSGQMGMPHRPMGVGCGEGR